MKFCLYIFAVLLYSVTSCQAQPGIKILNGSQFSTNSTIRYQVSGSQPYYYYVGMEKLLDHQWREIIIDISAQAPDRAAIIRRLTAGKPATGNYFIKHLPSVYRTNGSAYRLKVTYGNTATNPTAVQVSSEFYVR